jgi:hypothetical protein
MELRPCLIRMYDQPYREWLTVTQPAAIKLCEVNDLELMEIEIKTERYLRMQKVNLALKELQRGRNWICYADIDINLYPHPIPRVDFGMTQIGIGVQPSFFVVQNTPANQDFLQKWLSYPRECDEQALNHVRRRYPITQIPMDQIGEHYYASKSSRSSSILRRLNRGTH